MSFDNSNRFGLWCNKDRKEETHPHLAGQGETSNHQGHWISAWFSKDIPAEDKKTLADIVKRYSEANKRPFLNITIKPKVSGAAQAQEAINGISPPPDDSYDEDIPF